MMALPSPVEPPLADFVVPKHFKLALFHLPHCSFSSQSSKSRLKAQAHHSLPSSPLLLLSDAGTAFAHIALAEEADSSLRQISGVMLKKFMDKWWDVLGENNGLSEQVSVLSSSSKLTSSFPPFRPSFSPFCRRLLLSSLADFSELFSRAQLQQKVTLLPLLFSGLSLPSSKLRSQFAFSLSIPLLNPPASSEGGVLPQLLNLLAHGTQDQVHGAMRVFKEVVRKGELDLGEVAAGAGGGGGAGGNNGADERVLAVVRGLGPVLLGVLGNEVSHCINFCVEEPV